MISKMGKSFWLTACLDIESHQVQVPDFILQPSMLSLHFAKDGDKNLEVTQIYSKLLKYSQIYSILLNFTQTCSNRFGQWLSNQSCSTKSWTCRNWIYWGYDKGQDQNWGIIQVFGMFTIWRYGGLYQIYFGSPSKNANSWHSCSAYTAKILKKKLNHQIKKWKIEFPVK